MFALYMCVGGEKSHHLATKVKNEPFGHQLFSDIAMLAFDCIAMACKETSLQTSGRRTKQG